MASKAVLLIVCAVAVVRAGKNDNLKAVVQIFRHGQRLPISFYSSDPYSNLTTYWGGINLGQLTNEGKRQHYALGQYTRARYSDWLPKTYSDDDIYVQTTNVDRTHMSAQANLYGLYPASGNHVWKSGVSWQPIPVHPVDPRVVYVGDNSCPAYIRLLANVTNQEEYVSLNSTYSSMYTYLANYTNSTINSLNGAMSLHDTLFIENDVGFTLPSWTSAVFPEPLMTISTKMYAAYTYTTQMKRFIAGIFLNNLVENFEGIIADPTSSPKYQMFSAHDLNVFAILDSTGNTPERPVPFTSSLWFELRTVNFNNVVNLWMKLGTNLTQLRIAGCDLDCPLSTVKTLLSDILLDKDTFSTECAS